MRIGYEPSGIQTYHTLTTKQTYLLRFLNPLFFYVSFQDEPCKKIIINEVKSLTQTTSKMEKLKLWSMNKTWLNLFKLY